MEKQRQEADLCVWHLRNRAECPQEIGQAQTEEGKLEAASQEAAERE
jgi:hypothetical protein